MITGVKVAVVEDHESMRNALERLLDASSFDVAGFASADEFLRAADCAAFDCAVVDVHLPRKSGLQLQTEMRHSAPFTSLIFITGHADLALGVRAMREGAIDFLEKPVNDQALIEAIRRGALRSHYQGPLEQAGGRRTRHNRTNHLGASRARNGKDGRRIAGRPRQDGRGAGNSPAGLIPRDFARVLAGWGQGPSFVLAAMRGIGG